MKEKNIFIAGFGIPIFFLCIILALLIPVSPKTTHYPLLFILRFEDGYVYCSMRHQDQPTDYFLQNGRLLKGPCPENIDSATLKALGAPRQPIKPAIFLLYEPLKGTTKELSFEEVQHLHLQGGKVSPDGYTIDMDAFSPGSFFLFMFSRNNDGVHFTLKKYWWQKQAVHLQLPPVNNGQNSYEGPVFEAWVLS